MNECLMTDQHKKYTVISIKILNKTDILLKTIIQVWSGI